MIQTLVPNAFKDAITDGLNRKTLAIPHIWAERCRVMTGSFPGPVSFDHYPWQLDMLDSDAPEIVGQKAAQMGYTDTMLNRAFFTLDQLQRDVLYVLPNQNPDAGDFSQSRFDPALESSEHLSAMFTDVNKIGLKRSGSVCLYIRGSRSDAQLRSIPVGLVILDESDLMTEHAIALVKERLSGQTSKQFWMISTPTVTNYGINKSFLMSTQGHFYFKCPACSRLIELTFPECIEITAEDMHDPAVLNSFYKCPDCGTRLEQEAKPEIFKTARWVEAYANRMIKGFYINQLYSPTITAGELAKSYLESFTSRHYEQEFYNSKLGIPHVPKGAQVTEKDIKLCYGNHLNGAAGSGIKTLGIDVGDKCHWVVKEWDIGSLSTIDVNDLARAKTIAYGTMAKQGDGAGFHELDQLLMQFQPMHTVIDALPERRSSSSFCSRHPGNITMCIYNHNVKGKILQITDNQVVANRTYWLDTTLGRYKNKTVSLPADLDEEFQLHIQALVRRYDKNTLGEDVGNYIVTGADHYAHADNYAEIALAIAFEDGVIRGDAESPL